MEWGETHDHSIPAQRSSLSVLVTLGDTHLTHTSKRQACCLLTLIYSTFRFFSCLKNNGDKKFFIFCGTGWITMSFRSEISQNKAQNKSEK